MWRTPSCRRHGRTARTWPFGHTTMDTGDTRDVETHEHAADTCSCSVNACPSRMRGRPCSTTWTVTRPFVDLQLISCRVGLPLSSYIFVSARPTGQPLERPEASEQQRCCHARFIPSHISSLTALHAEQVRVCWMQTAPSTIFSMYHGSEHATCHEISASVSQNVPSVQCLLWPTRARSSRFKVDYQTSNKYPLTFGRN